MKKLYILFSLVFIIGLFAFGQSTAESWNLHHHLSGPKHYIASDYIKCYPPGEHYQDGFSYTAQQGESFVAEIDPFLVFPPEEGEIGGPGGEVGSDGIVGTNGSFAVSPNGAAMFAVNVDIPTGTGGMVPDIKVTYNSQQSNGDLGKGWGISGLSAISRGAKSEYHDGVNKPLVIGGDHSFSIDGTRLLKIFENNTYIEYRKEFDDQSKVLAYKNEDNNDFTHFLVYTKTGLVKEYGVTDDSKLVLSSESSEVADIPLGYFLNKITDVNGNYMLYEYIRDVNNGELHISTIKYTGNETVSPALNPYCEVSFTYETISAQNQMFFRTIFENGASSKNTKLLKTIETKYENQLFRKYELVYEQDEHSNNYLHKINESTSDESLNSLVFDWDKENDVFTFYKGDLGFFDDDEVFKVPIDFNSDGYTDFGIIVEEAEGDKFVLLENTQNGMFTEKERIDIPDDVTGVSFGDFTGNGFPDFIFSYKVGLFTKYKAYYSNPFGIGSELVYSPHLLSNLPANHPPNGNGTIDYRLHIGDFDGDGRSNLLITSVVSETMANLSYYLYTFNMSTAEMDLVSFRNTYIQYGDNYYTPSIEVDYGMADIHSRGMQSLVQKISIEEDNDFTYTKVFQVFAAANDELYITGVTPSLRVAIYNAKKMNFVDINADSKPDFVDIKDNEIIVYTNTGNKFVESLIMNYNVNNRKYIFADLNHDNRQDIFFYSNSSSSEFSLLINSRNNTGQVFTEKTFSFNNNVPPNFSTANPMFGDFNGDGIIEIVEEIVEKDDDDVVIQREYKNYYFTGADNPLITNFKNSMGDETIVYYHSITNRDVYSQSPFWSEDHAEFGQINYLGGNFLLVAKTETTSPFGTRYTGYKYQNALTHKKGRGFLGFKFFQVTDLYTYNSSIILNDYNDTYQYLYNRGSATTISINNTPKTFSSVENEIGFIENINNNKVIRPINTKSTTIFYDVNHNPSRYKWSRSIANVDDFDEYGNTLKITTQSGTEFNSAGHPTELESETILTSTYDNTNTSSEYILGRLRTSTAVKKVFNNGTETSQTRHSSYDYYEDGKLKKEILEPGHEKEYSKEYFYDGLGNITKSTEKAADIASGRSLESLYDDKGRFVLQTINDLHHKNIKEYDELTGNITKYTDANGLSTQYYYNSFGSLIKTVYPNSVEEHNVVRWVNNHPDAPEQNGETSAIYYNYHKTSGLYPILTFYDIKGRIVRDVSFDISGNKIYKDYIYSFKGNLKKESDPYYANANSDDANWTEYEYDELQRPSLTKLPADDNQERNIEFSYMHLKSSVINPNEQTFSSYINAQGKKVKTIDAKGEELVFEFYYENNKGVEKITDPENNEYYTYYDLFGNVWKKQDDDMGVSIFTYNGFGETIKKVDALGNEFNFFYDILGRVDYTTQLEGIIDYFYDDKENGIGAISRIDGYSEVNDFNYGEFGQLKYEETTFIDDPGKFYKTSYLYDDYGRVKYLVYPSGFQIRYSYAKNGVMRKIYNGNSNEILWKLNDVNALGQFKDVSIGADHHTNYEYYKKTGYIKKIHTENIQSMGYSYDNIGNMKSRSNYMNGLSEIFDYDILNRLILHQIGSNYSVDVNYDKVGNITYKSDVGTYSGYDEQGNGNRLLSIEGYLQDMNEITQGVQYTSFNKVKYIEQGENNEKRLYLSYGNKGQRIKQLIENGNDPVVTTKYISQIYQIEEIAGEEKEIHRIFGGDGDILAHYEKTENDNELIYFFKDHLGSIQSSLNEATGEIKNFSYDPWGQRRDPQTWAILEPYSNESEKYGFTGHEHIDLFQLVNMNGRIYDPAIGRFISADPFIAFSSNAQSYNRYSYVLNNPLLYTDPSGYIPHIGFDSWYDMAMFGIGVAIGVATAGVGTAALYAPGWVMMAGWGAINGYQSSVRMAVQSDASYSDIQAAGLRGFIGGALSAAAAAGAGAITKGLKGLDGIIMKAILHGATQGTARVIQGGKFEHGFFAGMVASLAGSASMKMGSILGKDAIGPQLFITAIAGGTAEKISGGSFVNGAMTGVMVLMLNHMGAHGGDEDNGLYSNDANKGDVFVSDQEVIRVFAQSVQPVPGTITLWGIAIYELISGSGNILSRGAMAPILLLQIQLQLEDWTRSAILIDYNDNGGGQGMIMNYKESIQDMNGYLHVSRSITLKDAVNGRNYGTYNQNYLPRE